MSVSCMLHTFLKYRNHYTSNIIHVVAAPMQCYNYYNTFIYMYTRVVRIHSLQDCGPLIKPQAKYFALAGPSPIMLHMHM